MLVTSWRPRRASAYAIAAGPGKCIIWKTPTVAASATPMPCGTTPPTKPAACNKPLINTTSPAV